MAEKPKTIASGANMMIQPRMFGLRVTGSRKTLRSAGLVPTAQATANVISMPTDIVP